MAVAGAGGDGLPDELSAWAADRDALFNKGDIEGVSSDLINAAI
jgi:hypothetical protein